MVGRKLRWMGQSLLRSGLPPQDRVSRADYPVSGPITFTAQGKAGVVKRAILSRPISKSAIRPHI